jgi:hypothetical protein
VAPSLTHGENFQPDCNHMTIRGKPRLPSFAPDERWRTSPIGSPQWSGDKVSSTRGQGKMAIAYEIVEVANFEEMFEDMIRQEQHDYLAMLEVRHQAVRSESLTGTLVAEEWLVRHGMAPAERLTCGACMTWVEGHEGHVDDTKVDYKVCS